MGKKGEKEKRKVEKEYWKCLDSLKSVVLNWEEKDDVLFQRCLKVALKEVQKIAKEYLPDGDLERVPEPMRDLSADNLEHEQFFDH